MELHQLRYLRTVVRLGSVTRAAEAEHVAQPSISKQIRLLERELETPLFHRIGRRVVPTEAALQLADCAERVLGDIADTAAALAEPGGGPQHLTICATETVANYLLPKALAKVLAAQPALRVSVEMLGADDAVARLLADRADLAIVPLPVVDGRLEVEQLLAEEILLALPASHPLAEGHGPVPLGVALSDPALLLPMRGHGLRSTIEQAAAEHGIQLRGRLELRSQQALLAMVAAGTGIGFAPRIAAAGQRSIAARPTEPSLHREVGWVRRRGRHLPSAAFELFALLAAPEEVRGARR